MTSHCKTSRKPTRKPRRVKPQPRNVLVYVGAVGLFAIAGHQCVHEKQAEATATIVAGLGLLGVGSQGKASVAKLDELTGHILDIRNNPAMPGTPIVPPLTEAPPAPSVPPAG